MTRVAVDLLGGDGAPGAVAGGMLLALAARVDGLVVGHGSTSAQAASACAAAAGLARIGLNTDDVDMITRVAVGDAVDSTSARL